MPSSSTLAVREDPQKGVCVMGLTLHKVGFCVIKCLGTQAPETLPDHEIYKPLFLVQPAKFSFVRFVN